MNLRGRFLVAVVLAAAVAGTGVALERVVGIRRPSAGTAATPVTGAWFCPHGGGEGWRGWVVVANPGTADVTLRLTSLAGGQAERSRGLLQPGTQRFFPVPAADMASATAVEFFGGPVAATMVVTRPDGGLGAEPCALGASRRWFLAEGSTVRGSGARLVVHNPFAEPAVVDVALVTSEGVIQTRKLAGVVVRPRRVVAFNLNEVALGKEPLAVAVRASLGRVAVGSFGVGEGALRSVVGVPAPARRWVLPAAGAGGTSDLILLAPGLRRVPFDVGAQGDQGRQVLLEDESLPGRTAETFVLEAGGASLVVQAQGRAPFVAGQRLRSAAKPAERPERAKPAGGRDGGRRGKDEASPREPPAPPPDTAATAGTATAARSWVATPCLPPGGGTSLLMLENPGTKDVTAQVRLLGDAGSPEVRPVDVSAGRSVIVELSQLAGQAPVTAVIAADGPLVAAQAARASEGYAVCLGIPL